jgi:hypothetical protein
VEDPNPGRRRCCRAATTVLPAADLLPAPPPPPLPPLPPLPPSTPPPRRSPPLPLPLLLLLEPPPHPACGAQEGVANGTGASHAEQLTGGVRIEVVGVVVEEPSPTPAAPLPALDAPTATSPTDALRSNGVGAGSLAEPPAAAAALLNDGSVPAAGAGSADCEASETGDASARRGPVSVTVANAGRLRGRAECTRTGDSRPGPGATGAAVGPATGGAQTAAGELRGCATPAGHQASMHGSTSNGNSANRHTHGSRRLRRSEKLPQRRTRPTAVHGRTRGKAGVVRGHSGGSQPPTPHPPPPTPHATAHLHARTNTHAHTHACTRASGCGGIKALRHARAPPRRT